MSVSAIIVAAGEGRRLGMDIPKQFIEINNRPLILYTLDKFISAEHISEIIVVAAKDWVNWLMAKLPNCSKPVTVVEGGRTRAESVFCGLSALSEISEAVAIHDAARPFVAIKDIEATIAKALETGAACLVGKVSDTLKTITSGEISATLDRSRIRRALTPQVFRTEIIRRAFASADLEQEIPDDSFLVEKLGYPVTAVESSSLNLKVTYPEDLDLARLLLSSGRSFMRIGFGSDIHRLASGRKLLIGGVPIRSDFGSDGHSDGDVLAHAVTDAILGALAAGDIGTHFPDTDPKWKGADSRMFLRTVADIVRRNSLSIVNIDSTVHLEKPKLRPYIDEIRASLAAELGINPLSVSVKAKSGEGVDSVGEGRAIRADAIVLLAPRVGLEP